MNAFNDKEIEEIIFLKSTQIGGTECLNNIICYIIAQDQAASMVVYPILDLAEWTSTNRLQPMIELSPDTRNNFNKKASQKRELQFNGMFLSISGANSPSSLSSKPIKNLLLDEIDKYPGSSDKEAEPISLAEERTRTYPTSKKIFKTSTPTTSNGNIIKAFNKADCQKYYYVPCPHCSTYQKLSFSNLKFDSKLKSLDLIRESAYYECEKCRLKINDKHKVSIIRDGKWVAEKNNGKKKTAFFINCLYSPWLRFGDIAVKWMESKDDPEKLQNFINSWLGEAWKQTESTLDHEIVFERQSENEEAIIPDEALILTAGVDVQKNSIYYTIRAWGTDLTSWGISYGNVESFQELEYIMNLPYLKKSGGSMLIDRCCIDTGHRTEEVYDFVIQNNEWATACKGSSRELVQKYNISSIDGKNSKTNINYSLSLYLVDTSKYKDTINSRIQRPNGKGSFMSFKGVGIDYARQLTSEEKIKENNKEVWKPKIGQPQNHYLDCEVYSFLAADIMQVRYLTTPIETQNSTISKEIKPNKTVNNWLKNTKNWIK